MVEDRELMWLNMEIAQSACMCGWMRKGRGGVGSTDCAGPNSLVCCGCEDDGIHHAERVTHG